MSELTLVIKCPKCGQEMTLLSKIGLQAEGHPDAFICSMNMPYQGCGYRITFVSQAQRRRLERSLYVEFETRLQEL